MQAAESIPARVKEGERHGHSGYFCQPRGVVGRPAHGGGCFQEMCPGPGLAWLGPQVRAVRWSWGRVTCSKAKAGHENYKNASGSELFS